MKYINFARNFAELCSIVVISGVLNAIHLPHYNDVMMSAIASQMNSHTIVYSTVYSGADKKNIKAPRHWPL